MSSIMKQRVLFEGGETVGARAPEVVPSRANAEYVTGSERIPA